MNTIPEPTRCSYCNKEAHWWSKWVHGIPEYKVIMDGDKVEDGRSLYCDDHQEHFSQKFRAVP